MITNHNMTPGPVSPAHHLTSSPAHRLTISPSNHLAISPSHRLTSSPSHLTTISQSHLPLHYHLTPPLENPLCILFPHLTEVKHF